MHWYICPVVVLAYAIVMGVASAASYECHTGYLMDKYCIELGYFLDAYMMENKTINALENAPNHTIHCLIEAPSCRNSGYELLGPPESGSKAYVRKYSLNKEGNDKVVKLGCEVGIGLEGKGDLECIGNTTDDLGNIGTKGFQPTVIGKLSGESTDKIPILDVLAVYHPKINCEEAIKIFEKDLDNTTSAATLISAPIAYLVTTISVIIALSQM